METEPMKHINSLYALIGNVEKSLDFHKGCAQKLNLYWNFPAVTGGQINSINQAGLETFRGNALEGLTREICQNSLDAAKNEEEPVIVEFNHFSLEANKFPGRVELSEAFQKCHETWEANNPKIKDFTKRGLQMLNAPYIQCLRISDFNTIGLIGADSGQLGTPWSALVKEAGSSNKGDNSGGSFGIGKSAPFLNSSIRTLFYSSMDETGYESYIGVSNLMSFTTKDKTTLGNGYFTYNENSNAIAGQLGLDPKLNRTSSGTDIFVAAFKPLSDWTLEVKNSVLKNFFITVMHKQLIVKINDFIINDENIGQLIMELEDSEENRNLKIYYELLTSDKTIKIPYPAKEYRRKLRLEEGEAALYLMNGEDLNRSVLMTRKIGMRLFEQKRISGSISFTGILMITGKNMNNIFKQMENPAHNEWKPNRYEEDPKLADKVFKELRSFLRDQVKEHYQEQTSEIMEAVGVNEFLPNRISSSEDGHDRVESLNSTIQSMETKKIKRPTKTIFRSSEPIEEELEKELQGTFGISKDGDRNGNGDGKRGKSGTKGNGLNGGHGDNGLDENSPGKLDTKPTKTPTGKPIQIQMKYSCINREKGLYKFMIIPEKTFKRGRLTFKGVGEQSDFNIPVKHMTSNDAKVEITSGNTVLLSPHRTVKKIMFNLEVDSADYCVMEVELSEV